MFREGFFVDPRLVIHALKMTDAGQLHEVFVALVCCRKEGEMGVSLFLFRSDRDWLGFLVCQGNSRRGEIGLHPDDRLDPGCLRRLVELDRTEDVPVICHRDRRHLAALRFFHQLLDPDRPVESRIFGVQVEVNERVGRHGRAESGEDVHHHKEELSNGKSKTRKRDYPS